LLDVQKKGPIDSVRENRLHTNTPKVSTEYLRVEIINTESPLARNRNRKQMAKTVSKPSIPVLLYFFQESFPL